MPEFEDYFSIFKENLSKKVLNPFLGTYILVYLIRNWQLVISLYYLDSFPTIKGKLAYIKPYFYSDWKDFLKGVFINFTITLIAISITYLFLSASRLIINLFEKGLIPYINLLSDKFSVVSRELYNKLWDEVKSNQKKILTLETENKSLNDHLDRLKDSESETLKLKGFLNKIFALPLKQIDEFKYLLDLITKGFNLTNLFQIFNNEHFSSDVEMLREFLKDENKKILSDEKFITTDKSGKKTISPFGKSVLDLMGELNQKIPFLES